MYQNIVITEVRNTRIQSSFKEKQWERSTTSGLLTKSPDLKGAKQSLSDSKTIFVHSPVSLTF